VTGEGMLFLYPAATLSIFGIHPWLKKIENHGTILKDV
jgi:hypothetical protein